MPILYLDLFSGISGDMLIGALLDLGVAGTTLERGLQRLRLDGYHLHMARRQKSGIEGVKFDVHLTADGTCSGPKVEAGHGHSHEHPHGHGHGHDHSQDDEHAHTHEHGSGNGLQRDFKSIRALIEASDLSPWVQERSIAVFRRVAVAEGKVHGLPPEQVHFHEVGAVDSIIDIVGACICLEALGCPRVLASAVVEGTGWVKCAHGRFPVPTPATLEILGARGIGITQCEEPHELVTPTGAALLAEFAESFGPMRGLIARKTGYGLGTRDNKTRPNVVRAILADAVDSHPDEPGWERDTVAVLETNLDDVTGEVLGHFVESTLKAGALDVFHAPVHMKKNRPGILLTVLCAPEDADRLTERLLRHTSAFGVRRSVLERRKLHRDWLTVKTPMGEVKVKVGRLGDEVVQIAPEFEVCRDKAVQAGVPIMEVYEAARAAARLVMESKH
jgi:pyridinium-3,5-bisthiocarboxylic acid mononucleotide nickel chelatase